jgi:hypothetical protein
LKADRVIAAGTGEFSLTGNAAGLTYSEATGGVRHYPKRKRRARDESEGNRDFTGKRNSRPGVAEEEMREVMAAVKRKAPAATPTGWDEDDDEEAILWLIH